MLDNAFDANKTDASDTKVSHELFRVSRTKIGIFHHLLVFVCKFQGKVVFGELLGFEGLLESGLAQWAEGQALLLNLD